MREISKTLVWTGIALILCVGLVHAIDAPDSFGDAAYKGWLFCANAAGSLVAALGIWRRNRLGWHLGIMIAAGAFAGYIASRTVGLPMLPLEPGNWLEPLGVVSMIAEAGFMALYALVMKRTGALDRTVLLGSNFLSRKKTASASQKSDALV